MNELSCAQADELAGAAALGAVDADEAQALLRHLRSCPEPHTETRGLLAAAEAVSAAVAPIAPRPELRERLMATVERTPQGVPAAAAPAPRVERRQSRDWLGWLRPGWARGIAVVAVPLVVILAVLAVRLQSDVSARDATLRQVADALSRGDQVVAVGGSAGAGYLVHDADRATFIVADLPAPAAGGLYEMWLIDPDGHAAPAGTLSGGGDLSVAQVDGSIGQAATFAVTVEPHRVEQPTSDPILVADLSQ